MIVAAALCPCPPLLARELTGQADVLPELRAACAAAVARLIAAGPGVIAVTGPDAATGRWPADGRLDLAAFAPALAPAARADGGPARAAAARAASADGGPARVAAAPAARPALPLSLGIGARLLDEAGYRGPRACYAIGAEASPERCLRLGEQVAASAPRVALLALGDGSARRSASAPGALDERAAPFDAAVAQAVRDGDLAALARVDPGLAASLLAAGRPAWQVLAGALGPATRPQTELLYDSAPLGVTYLAATFTPRPGP